LTGEYNAHGENGAALGAAAAMLFGAASAANAETNAFIGGNVSGVLNAEVEGISFDEGSAFGFEVGAETDAGARFSVVVEHGNADLGPIGEATYTTESFRTALVLPIGHEVKPYVVGEAGLMQGERGAFYGGVDGSGVHLAYGLGVDFPLGGKFAGSIEYVRHHGHDFEIEDTYTVDKLQWDTAALRIRRAWN
jgi:hypothetical protein